jgi:hypothetical protein
VEKGGAYIFDAASAGTPRRFRLRADYFV